VVGSDIGTERVDGGADAALVRALHDAHAGALYSFCLSYTGDPQRAEDIVQEVLVRAWRHAATLRQDPRPVRPWLMSVARNLLTDAHRAEQSRPTLAAEGTAVDSEPGRDDIGRAVESWTMAEALGGCPPSIGRCWCRPTGWAARSGRSPRCWASRRER